MTIGHSGFARKATAAAACWLGCAVLAAGQSHTAVSGLFTVDTRGQYALKPDLVIESIEHSPANPSPGDDVVFTVTLANEGEADVSGIFNTGFWADRSSAPDISTSPEADQDYDDIIPAGDTRQLTFGITAPAAGTYTAWAYADRYQGDSEIDESNEGNNAGPAPSGYSWTVGGDVQLIYPNTPTNVLGGDLGGVTELSIGIVCGGDAAWVEIEAKGETYKGGNYPAPLWMQMLQVRGRWRIQTTGAEFLSVNESTLAEPRFLDATWGEEVLWPLSDWAAAQYEWVARDSAGQELRRGEFQLGQLNLRGGTVGAGRPVLLLHGLLSGGMACYGSPFIADLAQSRPVYTLDYPNTGSLRDSVDLLHVTLAKLTAQTGDSQIHVVGHSMGGVLTRLYKQKWDGARLDRFVSVGAPFEGAPLAQIVKILFNDSMLAGIHAAGTPAIEDLADPQAQLELWRNDVFSVVNDGRHLALIGTYRYQELTEEEYENWHNPSELPYIDLPPDENFTFGSDGVVAWTSQGKRPLMQPQNIYVQASHLGYFSPQKNRQYDKLVTAITGFLANGTAILEPQPEYVQRDILSFQVVRDVGENQPARRMGLAAKGSSSVPVQGAVLMAYDNDRHVYTLLSSSTGADGNLCFIPADAEPLFGLIVVAPGYNPVALDDLTVDEVQLVPNLDGRVGAFREALNTPELVWDTGGHAEWIITQLPGNAGENAVQSGPIGNNQGSWIQTMVTGPGTISFHWMVSSEEYFDHLNFFIDDSPRAYISGNRDNLSLSRFAVPAGVHVLRWQYDKDDIDLDPIGFDCGWLDQVAWEPGQTRAASENDFNGDGISDLVTFWPEYADWVVSAYDSIWLDWFCFGWSAVKPVPADYDGDRVTDVAVYHPASGNWYIRPSGGGGDYAEAFGWSAAIPLPGDYDGDGIADLAVFHQKTARWYFRMSSGGADSSVAFGWSSVIPVPADYDGDGAVDVAVYHPASGNWYVSESSTGDVLTVPWGWSSAIPVPADYDGDGRADIAVFHRKTATWYIRYSGGGDWVGAYGWSSVVPVPADYDGDGRADIAVYHPAGRNWYIRQSSDLVTVVKSLGGPGQIPVLLNNLIHSWFRLP